MKKIRLLILFILSVTLSSCGLSANENEPVTILVAAAASLEKCFADELIPMFCEKNPGIAVDGTYDASGKLQTQIEEGLEADVFMPASTKNMDALVAGGRIDSDSVVGVLENQIVLIAPASSHLNISSFEDVVKADTIAIGDPDSVPAGQYAREALENLGVWDSIADRLSLGTNVAEVLAWVGEGSADVGIVYATDAASSIKVKVIAEAPEGSLKTKVIYPVGIVSESGKKDAAKLFVQFLCSYEALEVFEMYGFAVAKQ